MNALLRSIMAKDFPIIQFNVFIIWIRRNRKSETRKPKFDATCDFQIPIFEFRVSGFALGPWHNPAAKTQYHGVVVKKS